MSFHFEAQAHSKEQLKKAIAARMAEVVHQQPGHSKDQALVLSTTSAYLDQLLKEPAAGQVLVASIAGSIGWEGWDGPTPLETISSINLTVNIWLRADQ